MNNQEPNLNPSEDPRFQPTRPEGFLGRLNSGNTYRNSAIAILVVAGLYLVAQQSGWVRQIRARAQGPQAPLMSEPVAKCWNLHDHGDDAATQCFQELTLSRDALSRAEGLWGLGNYRDANAAFQQAMKDDTEDPARHVRWGSMFYEFKQPADARAEFEEAIKRDEFYGPAILGLAYVFSDEFSTQGLKYADQALEVNPDLYQAHEIEARIHLEDDDPAKAREDAEKALEISDQAIDALVILATADMLDDKPGTEYWDRIFAINPKYGKGYETAAGFFVINRRYEEGIELYRKALEIDPNLQTARANLGVNLMRFGRDEEARPLLEEAFYAGWGSWALVSNTLKLLDSYENFDTFTTDKTVLKLHQKEAALLRPYFQSELDRAIATYEDKYKFKLDQPVRLEVYPDHEDFAVRTMGLPGLGALGVTFGNVVAMDSPSGREPGDFHWASTMWHELSHVYVLSMTGHRVPRWFTEGVAVHEETATEPYWGDRLAPPMIEAIKDDKLLPIADLDRGFIHPSYPEQVVVSYFQGGKVIDYIVETWGYDKILDMIHAFADHKDSVTVINEVLGVTPEEFDEQFLPWLKAQTKSSVEGFDHWRAEIKLINDAAKEEDWDQVISKGLEIRDVYPDYVEAGSIYEFLARAYEAKGNKAAAIQQLKDYSDIGGREPDTLVKLAEMQTEAGDADGAIETLERLNMVYLENVQGHRDLGDLYMEKGDAEKAVREYRSVAVLDTTDPAGAHYNLARALHGAGKDDEALDEVFAALEVAPSYKPAQQLLLEMDDAGSTVN